ncbi:MAG: hypothetical protein H7Y33_07620, partial [Cytophagales bacterium]|nr:hypothetical protein [Rhizobacter sp.]
MNHNSNGRRRTLHGAVGLTGALLGLSARSQEKPQDDPREIRIGQSAVLTGPLAPSVTS